MFGLNRNIPHEPSAAERAAASLTHAQAVAMVVDALDQLLTSMAAQRPRCWPLINKALDQRNAVRHGLPAVRPPVPVIPGPAPLPRRKAGGVDG